MLRRKKKGRGIGDIAYREVCQYFRFIHLEGLIERSIFDHSLLKLREQVIWISGGRALQVNETLSAKALVCLRHSKGYS